MFIITNWVIPLEAKQCTGETRKKQQEAYELSMHTVTPRILKCRGQTERIPSFALRSVRHQHRDERQDEESGSVSHSPCTEPGTKLHQQERFSIRALSLPVHSRPRKPALCTLNGKYKHHTSKSSSHTEIQACAFPGRHETRLCSRWRRPADEHCQSVAGCWSCNVTGSVVGNAEGLTQNMNAKTPTFLTGINKWII